ncbi:hypothetical protein N0V90_013320 [Kalmusia sp. IMI 367209]|nr:hypothetical protein N0V90_013320 [Kalmusia sp. IMI 367209]
MITKWLRSGPTKLVTDEVVNHEVVADEVVTDEVVMDEATCLRKLHDAEEIHGPYSPEVSSALGKLCDFYKKIGESANVESVLQRMLMLDERTAGRTHGDTIATSFSLTDVYIQRGKLTEALSLLERGVESSRKLGAVMNSEMRALHKTEMDIVRLMLYQLGLDFRNRNYHDGAVDVLEHAFENSSRTLGDTHTTTVAMGKMLSFSYLQQFYQQPLRNDRPRYQCVVKLTQLCERILKVERSPIWALGLMCLRSNDAANASFAFKQSTNLGSCDTCKERIKLDTRWLACKSCLFVFVCDDCYLKWMARTEQNEPITTTCAGHAFYILGVGNSDQNSTGGIENEEQVRLWLRGLLDQKTKQATTVAFLDHWERLGKPEELQEFRNPIYFLESDALPAHVDEVKAKTSPIQRLKWYKSWITHSVPILLGLFFGSKGFSNVELPQWRLGETASEEDLQPALIEQVQAALKVAGKSTAPALEVDMPRDEPEPAVDKLYQTHRIATPGDTIRVLALLPEDGPTLKATMFCVNLSSGPIYEALSYVWGDMEADASYFLDIDGTIMKITPNLHHALQALRPRQSPRVLWVDAVCVNQNDNKDKETQICMMEEIYRSANHVAVYLGEPATVSVTLFSFLNRDVHGEDSAEKAVEELGQKESDIRQLLEAFVHFCHLPWWNRIWVQQEYSLAQTNPTFHLGKSSIHISALLRDWRMLQGKVATHLVPFAGGFKLDIDVLMSWQPIMRQILHVYGVLTLRSAHNRSEFPHLWLPRGILKKVNLRCTNPRDRIYGMRSFLDPVAQAVFTPNYSEPVGTTFHKLATWILAIDGWQQVFWWYPYRLSPNMPSWVPDFTKPIPESAFLEYNLFDYGKLRKSSPCPLAIRGGVLAMEGYLLDSVNHVYAINQPDWPSTVQELWFLENIFAATPSAALLRKAPPVFKALPMLHSRALVRKWISPTIKRDMESIVFELPPFNIFEKHDILKKTFNPFVNEIKDAFNSHMLTCESLVEQLQGLSREITLATLQARLPISFQIHEHLRMASAFIEICTRLSTLYLFLQESNHSATDLFGAALFDYPNLLDQIEHLRKSSLPCQYTESQISAISAKLRNIKASANNQSATNWGPSNKSGVAAQIKPCYELLQHHITACEHEEEVRMRVRLILSYANAIRAFPDSAKTRSSTTHDSYHQYRDRRILDSDTLIKRIAEDNDRQETLRQMIFNESRQYFESLAAKFPDDEDVSAMLAQYQTVREEGQAASETLKITTETATAKLEDAKPDILANSMFHHNEKAFHRESYEYATSLSGRTFFSTEFGLVGIGCQGVSDIRVGDKVVVLKNTEFPMVVREMEDKGYHEIVGYVIMRGFAYEDFEKLGRFEKPLRQAFYFR